MSKSDQTYTQIYNTQTNKCMYVYLFSHQYNTGTVPTGSKEQIPYKMKHWREFILGLLKIDGQSILADCILVVV